MVKLDRIYTGGGDGGETSLADGTRVSKASARIEAQGDIDEANAVIGLARAHAAALEDGAGIAETLARIQNDLFDIGADISSPGSDAGDGRLRIQPGQVARLEAEIDTLNQALAPLDSFVLPGGSAAAAWLHLARTVVRRAERRVVALADGEPVNPCITTYLNRLSDLLFVMARCANQRGSADVLWRPGLTADDAG
jgi:cob(I)alamin adenosyltransferase